MAAFFSLSGICCVLFYQSTPIVLLISITVKLDAECEFILSPHMCSVETVPLVVIRFFFWLHHAACGILVPYRTGIKPQVLAVEVQILTAGCWKIPRFVHLGDCPGNVNERMHRAS